MELVIASSNSHKVLLLKEIIHELLPSVSICSLFDFQSYVPQTDCEMHKAKEKAYQKATHAAKHLQICAIAEEWRLVIPSLERQYEEIFLPNETSFQQSKKILMALETKKEYERSAFLESSVSCCFVGGKTYEASACIEGVITACEKGKGGNDFDSIFIKYDYAKTLAELSPQVRCRISHRRKALEKLFLSLETCFAKG